MKIKNILMLSGGDSTRFWPLKDKTLMKFSGESLIEHQIKELSKWTDNLIIVTAKQNKDKIEEIVNGEKLKIKDCNITYTVQDSHFDGQAGAILSAKGKIQEEVLVCNANDIFDFSFITKLTEMKDKKEKGLVILAKKLNEYFPGGYVAFEGEKMKGIIEKPGADKAPSDIMKLVVDYFFDFGSLIKAIEGVKTDNDDWYEQALSKIIELNDKADYILYDNYWYTIKYPWQVLDMNKYFLSQIKQTYIDKTAKVSKNAVIEGIVHIEKNVKIGDFAKIVGPCYIGEGTIVGDFAMIRESHIGDNSLIGGYSEVTRSYLGSQVMLHRNYVGDSILDDGVMMGAGAITANFRFDGKNVVSMVNGNKMDTKRQKLGAIIGNGSKVGVNSTTIPGVKIGSLTFIGPNSLIDEDVDDRMFLFKGVKKDNKL